ncbi:type II secretion system F family protein [Klebsiella aerogenes]
MRRIIDTLTGLLPADLLDDMNRWLARKTFTTSERRTLYEDLAFLLDNNKSLEVALTDMYSVATSFGQERENGVAMCLKDCLTALRNGKSLDIGLSEWVPTSEIALIGAGVTDGNLSGALKRAITIVDSTAGMKSACYSTLAYPFLLITSMFFMMDMSVSEFIPKLVRVAPRETWHGALWWMAAISEFFVVHAAILSLGALFFSAWVIWTLPNFTGRFRRQLDHLMPWSLYREMQGVSFLLNLSALMRANMKVLDTLSVLARYASPWLLERIDATRKEVNSGAHLGLALKNTGMDFPGKECVNKLILLTAGDNAEDIIENFAQAWLLKTQARIKTKINRLSTVCFLLVGGYLALLVLAGQQISALAGSAPH